MKKEVQASKINALIYNVTETNFETDDDIKRYAEEVFKNIAQFFNKKMREVGCDVINPDSQNFLQIADYWVIMSQDYATIEPKKRLKEVKNNVKKFLSFFDNVKISKEHSWGISLYILLDDVVMTNIKDSALEQFLCVEFDCSLPISQFLVRIYFSNWSRCMNSHPKTYIFSSGDLLITLKKIETEMKKQIEQLAKAVRLVLL